jgi:peptide/nickel transport system substrate-binding protein
MKAKFVRIVLVSLLLLAAFNVVGTSMAQDDDNTLILARAVDATGLDPHLQTTFASLRLLAMIYEPLLIPDQNLELQPVLAESWEFSDDGMTLTFHLRDGVTFHDGSAMTSEDVVATFERILNEETGAAARSNYTSIESMDAPDDLTVIFHLSKPDAPILAAMGATNAAILSSDVIANDDPALVTIGTGPFKLDNWTPEESTTLSAFDGWWGDGPFIDGIDMRIIPDEASILAALRAGTVDFALLEDPLVATLLIGDDEITLQRKPVISYDVLQLRAAVEPLNILEVRQAMSCAIDRQEVVDTALLGEALVTGPFTMPSFALPTDELFCYTKDLDRARELMAQAGMEDGFTLKVMVANAEPPVATSVAQNIQAQLAEINIDVEIEALEFATYVDRWLAGDFMAAVARNGGRVDPYPMYSRYWQYDAQFQNVAGYIDDTLDDLMKRGQVETDVDARYEIFAELQRHLTETSPWIWLYSGYNYTSHQSYVVGFEPTATNETLYFLYAATLDK